MDRSLPRDSLSDARDYITENADELWIALFEHEFFGGSEARIVGALGKYQNDDGGFGHGLEPDFLLPDSSAIATTVACQTLVALEEPPRDMIASTLSYYENTYDGSRNRWWTVPMEVNAYPHAPWWTYDDGEGGTVIDRHWGNPSAEILGYLWKWREGVGRIDLAECLERAVDYLDGLESYESEHEVYCYIRMYDQLPEEYRRRLRPSLGAAIEALVSRDASEWSRYVPKPLDFVQTPDHELYPHVQDAAERHLDFLVSTVEDGIWRPPWKWTQYPADWEHASRNWAAILTTKNYRILRDFDRS